VEIVVLVKPTPEAETRLRPTPDGRALDPEGVKWVLSGYDESAVEQALLLKESVPGTTVRALSLGVAPRTDEVVRAALALGCDSAAVADLPKDLAPDPLLIARAAAVVLGRWPSVGLVLAGKQAGDDEEGLVPGAVAELRGVEGYGFVTNLRWDAARNRFTFDRAIEGAVEHYALPPPVVLGLQQAWNDPRTAKLPNILKSRKAPIERVPWSEVEAALGAPVAAGTRPAGFRLPTPRSGARMIASKTPEEAAAELVRVLREEAKVFP